MHTHEQTHDVLTWQAPAHLDHERSDRWYWIAGMLTMIAIVYSIISSAWTTAVVVALTAGLYFLVRNENHPLHTIRILPLGIEYDGKLEAWDNWRSFWILVGKSHAQLHIAHKGMRPELMILIRDVDPFVLRDALSRYIPQNPEKRERLLDAFIRFCKI